MGKSLRSVTRNESSNSVTLLHQALAALGIQVDQKERNKRQAGESTLAVIKDLQSRLNIPADEDLLADSATIIAIEDALRARGLTSARRSFTVSGTVRDEDGSVEKRQRLLVFDLDLRGVGVYRSVASLKEIDNNPGFEFLGETVSDNQGNYNQTFYDWQYRNAERKKADIVVFAVDEDQLIGRSRLVNPDDYSARGIVRQLDVIITRKNPQSEYEQMMSVLNRFLEESGVSLGEIAASYDQLVFTAGELDLALPHLLLAAQAELLKTDVEKRLSHELLYGLGRQSVRLSWAALYNKPVEELLAALRTSIEQRIISGEYSDRARSTFVKTLLACASQRVLQDEDERQDTLNQMLLNALPEEVQRAGFVNALRSFDGSNFQAFWNEHLPAQPEFREHPELVSQLLLTQQLTLLTANHQDLVSELQTNRGINALTDLLDLQHEEWIEIISRIGVPNSISGDTDEARHNRYANQLQSLLSASFPTQRIAGMIARDELPIERTEIARMLSSFLGENSDFEIATSRVHDFEEQIIELAGDESSVVTSELMKLQRIYQVSANPDNMSVLLQNGLYSARSISNIPCQSFIDTYAVVLGGEYVAYSIHQRASHISSRSELNAMHLMEYSHAATPAYVLGINDYDAVLNTLENKLPNYSELFGSPDICECEHCRSVYSASAYFVDLLRFLWCGTPNADNNSPLEMLSDRRPDLLHLPLTCENTNTVIPYIDLANEVLEYYTANGSLTNFQGFNTGDTTAEELRANPQNFNLEAYRTLNQSTYPFNLPYHQPLDTIRTFSDQLKVSRHQAMGAMIPEPDQIAERALAAEANRISPEEYLILTREQFDETADTREVHEFYGYAANSDLENLSAVRELLDRSGLAYTDLVELLKTQFINPNQFALTFIEKIFAYATIDAADLYARLEQIEAGNIDPASDPEILSTINGYNAATASNITPAEFQTWVFDHLDKFRQVITLYEADSKCDLDTTAIRTLQSIYEQQNVSGVAEEVWSRLHRFVRLWRKLGWAMHELDLTLNSLGDTDITAETILKLQHLSALSASSRRPLNQLAVLWGNIDVHGHKPLYEKLFLNRAMRPFNPVFEADGWGEYLSNSSEVLGDHQSTLLAAFRIREEDLEAIYQVAQVIDGGNRRPLDPATDILSLPNLSTLYRHVVLAKMLKLRVTELCKLVELFSALPFSVWDLDQNAYVDITPDHTWEFYQLATAIKNRGFKADTLEYIFRGTLPAESTLGIAPEAVRQTAKAVRDSFTAIEQDHPEIPDVPLTAEIIGAKLGLTYPLDIVARFLNTINNTAVFQTTTDNNLNIAIPLELADKYSYVNGSGRFLCDGVMTDDERITLNALPNANANFQAAVDEVYFMPETFLSDQFGTIFTDLAEANAVILNHPAQVAPSTLDEKLSYVYEKFLPALRTKLQHDSIVQHIATLIGLTAEATAQLLVDDIESLVEDLTLVGFSADYFASDNWTNLVLERIDDSIDFSWSTAAPDPLLPSDNFSARWQGLVAAPASGEYTLRIEVTEADEVFNLYLDGALLLQKTAVDTATVWEINAELNAAKMHALRLEYAEVTQEAGIRLSWKSTTSALDVLPANAVFPTKIMDGFDTFTQELHRASKVIKGFDLSETELEHIINYNVDFDSVDLTSLTPAQYVRINNYVDIRENVPQSRALLTDVFALANRIDPTPTTAELVDLLHLASAWDLTNLEYLVNVHFSYNTDDFKNEISLMKLFAVMEVVSKTGISAETIAQWGAVETDFDELYATAELIKNTVRAKYTEEDWLDLAGNLNDQIRENQQRALVGHLLTQPAIQAWGARDADGLFEYFLIDVQMSACMGTSRIVQANAAVQMFINRCLLNLESNMLLGQERGVSPAAINKERWQWMKNYRVWEANRKVFLYPENWLEPEWRMDRSEFFKELESHLVQNDITERTTEEAFRNYLLRLNEVANLDVCGSYQENDDDGKLKFLHVFARTNNTPYKVFYRRWNAYRKWSAWESVPVDLASVEDGDYSGVHIIPVVWKKRLFLFWPEIIEMPIPAAGTGNQSAEDLASQSVSSTEAEQQWEVRLAWSEYVDGTWSAKQVSKEFAIVRDWFIDYVEHKARTSFKTAVSAENKLTISMWNNQYLGVISFQLSDIQSPIKILPGHHAPSVIHETSDDPDKYYPHFMRRAKYGYSDLTLLDNLYLRTKTQHQLLFGDNSAFPENRVDTPFFFTGEQRTYFARTVNILLVDAIRNPATYKPYIPDIFDDSGFTIPIDFPNVFPGGTRVDGLPVAANGRPRGNNSSLVQASVANEYTTAQRSAVVNDMVRNMALLDTAQVNGAFGLSETSHFDDWGIWLHEFDLGLEFHTFYHPYSGKFMTRLNQGGIPAMMGSDTENPFAVDAIKSDNGVTFEDEYDPNFYQGLVQKPSDFNDPLRTYYKENVCFDPNGANRIYNYELFFHAPLYIAIRLSKNGMFEEAMKWFHFIFDPTTNELPGPGESEMSRFWKVFPFKKTPVENLEDWLEALGPNTNPDIENMIIGEWRDNPFDPHLIASNRPLAYMKHVVIKYVENLIAWGDSLFTRFTRESVYEALQLYVLANHILGPKPQFVPKRGSVGSESYSSLQNKWDDFSNAMVELENMFPFSSEASSSSNCNGSNLLGVGPSLYFCIPSNNKLLEHWDTVADRLYKIRNCQDITGTERTLALFAPPIDPAALIDALSKGLSLGSILADLGSPPPLYRFSFLIRKANEFCEDVKSLGSAVLSAIEKRDAEELSRLRASQETQLLELVTAVRERHVLDARAQKENLLKAREGAEHRLEHYYSLFGTVDIETPDAPEVESDLDVGSQLPADTALGLVEIGSEVTTLEAGSSSVTLISQEQAEIDNTNAAMQKQNSAMDSEKMAATMNMIPNISANIQPLGNGTSISFGGSNIGAKFSAEAKSDQIDAAWKSHAASGSAKVASFIRREQDWALQLNMAVKEIIQLDKQITSADIRIQIAEKELSNHLKQIKHAQDIELHLKDKFSNQELYQWMKEQLFAVYKQSYNLAYDMARKAEKAYQFERGLDTVNFIQYGYWDNAKEGLVSGEKLQLALRQLEKSFLEENRRELEVRKNVSLAMLDPLALIELRETGKCYVSVPEEMFDLDFLGHYFRRIKSVSLTVPCVVGPYTAVNCTVRLLKNSVRINTSMNSSGNYEHENDEGILVDDDRFRSSYIPVSAIAASSGQNDNGMFEFSFNDDRYLPFEGAGAISEWLIELSTEAEFRQFDYSTISDVILHLDYTARENGGLFQEKAAAYLKDYLANIAELPDQPLMKFFSMKHDFATEWHRFLHPSVAGSEQILDITAGHKRFPYLVQDRPILISKMEVFVRSVQEGDYNMEVSYTAEDDSVVISNEITLPQNDTYGGLNKATLNVLDAGMNLEEVDIAKPIRFKLKHSSAADYSSLSTQPDEVTHMFVVVHYRLG